jgi:hypothetical protein
MRGDQTESHASAVLLKEGLQGSCDPSHYSQPHTACVRMLLLQQWTGNVMHPPYKPDLMPTDFCPSRSLMYFKTLVTWWQGKSWSPPVGINTEPWFLLHKNKTGVTSVGQASHSHRWLCTENKVFVTTQNNGKKTWRLAGNPVDHRESVKDKCYNYVKHLDSLSLYTETNVYISSKRFWQLYISGHYPSSNNLKRKCFQNVFQSQFPQG